MHKKKTTVGDVDLQIMEVIRDIQYQAREKYTTVEEGRSFTGLKEEAFCRILAKRWRDFPQPAEEMQK